MEQTFRSVVYGRIISPILFFLFSVDSMLAQTTKTYTPQGTEVTLDIYSESFTTAEKAAKKAYCTQHIHELFIGEKQLQLIIVMHTLGV